MYVPVSLQAPLPSDLAEAIGNLPALKALSCQLSPGAATQHLPVSLRELSVVLSCQKKVSYIGDSWGTTSSGPDTLRVDHCLDLSHLKELTSLHVSLHVSLEEPLVSFFERTVMVQLELAQGVRLETLGWYGYQTGALQLHHVLSVQHMQIDMHNAGRLLDVIHKLAPRPLVSLQACGTLHGSSEQMKAITAALSKMTCLSRLDLEWVKVAGEEGGEEVPWGASLAGLPLQHLQLGISKASPADLLHLSKLTALTSLHLNVSNGLDDATAAVVVRCLTRLQGLSLQTGLQNLSLVVPGLGGLTQLSSLRLICPRYVHMSVVDLQALAPLQRLQSLVVPLGSDCTTAVVRKWLAGMPCLDSIS
jgi:hypothetical protein